MTSTSNKAALFLVAIVLSTVLVSASHNGGGSGSGSITDGKYGDYEGFGVPTYNTQGEILTKLVAPFLLITLILQIGLQMALEAVLINSSRKYYNYNQIRRKKKQVRKHSTLMALAIAGMTVPSPIFKYINEYVAYLYGGITWGFLALVIVVVLWTGMQLFLSSGGKHE